MADMIRFKKFKQFAISKLEYLSFSIIQLFSYLGKFLIEFTPSLLLPLSVYGKFSYVFSLGTIIYGLLGIGLPISLLRLIPEIKLKHRIPTITYQVFILQVIIILISIPLILNFLKEKINILESLFFLVFLISFTIHNSLPTIFRSLGKIKIWFFFKETSIQIFSSIIFVSLVLINFLNNDYKINSLTQVLFIISISSIFSLYLLSKKLINDFDFKKKDLVILPKIIKNILIVSLPLFATNITYIMMSRIDIIMLEKFVNYKSIGLYSIFIKFSQLSMFGWNIISAYLIPKLNQLFVDKDREAIVKVHRQYIFYSSLTTLLIIFVILFAFKIGLLGRFSIVSNNENFFLFLTLLFNKFIQVLLSSYGYILICLKLEKLFFFNSLISISSVFLTNLYFIPKMGIQGAALSTLICFTLIKILEISEVYFFSKDLFLQNKKENNMNLFFVKK